MATWKALTFEQAQALHELGCKVLCWHLYDKSCRDQVKERVAGKRDDIGWEFDLGWIHPDTIETAFFTEVE